MESFADEIVEDACYAFMIHFGRTNREWLWHVVSCFETANRL